MSFGTLVGRGQVEAAAVKTLQAFILDYLAEVERVLDLAPETIPPPPDLSYGTPTSSIHGGMDFEEFTTAQSPEIIVVVRPDADAIRLDQNNVRQDYRVEVGVVAVDEDENATRELADWYGTAIMECLVQQGTLGGIANWTNLIQAPDAAFAIPDNRRVIIETVVFQTCVIPVVQLQDGPRVPSPTPYEPPASGPVVEEFELVLTPTPAVPTVYLDTNGDLVDALLAPDEGGDSIGVSAVLGDAVNSVTDIVLSPASASAPNTVVPAAFVLDSENNVQDVILAAGAPAVILDGGDGLEDMQLAVDSPSGPSNEDLIPLVFDASNNVVDAYTTIEDLELA